MKLSWMPKWSIHCPCIPILWQYPTSNCRLSSNDSQTRRKRIFKDPRRLNPGFSGNNLWKSSKSKMHPLKSTTGCYIRIWCIYWMRYSSLSFCLESRIRSNFHSSTSFPSSSLMRTNSAFQELLICSWSGSLVAITSQRRELWKVLQNQEPESSSRVQEWFCISRILYGSNQISKNLEDGF